MILIIDDELRRNDPILSFLQAEGYKVLAFDNGVDCIAFIENKPLDIDLIIVDLLLPYGEKSVTYRVAGVELIKDIQKILKNVPIIVYTNINDYKIFDSLEELGVNRILRKSDILLFEFLEAIKSAISNKK